MKVLVVWKIKECRSSAFFGPLVNSSSGPYVLDDFKVRGLYKVGQNFLHLKVHAAELSEFLKSSRNAFKQHSIEAVLSL